MFQKGHKIFLGRKHSEETKNKIREHQLGQGNSFYGKKHSQESLKKIVKRGKDHPLWGKHHSEDAKIKMSKSAKRRGSNRIGKRFSEESKQKMSLAQRGEKNHNWKGGRSLLHNEIRKSLKYRIWRSDVFSRDEYACVKCGATGDIWAHHIFMLAKILDKYNIKTLEDADRCEELWNINNGITLCTECHKREHTK